MLHVEVSRIAGDRLRLDDAISYLASQACPAIERQSGSLGTSLLIDPATGAITFESFWASQGALVSGEDAIAASVREAGRYAHGATTRTRYEVVVFEREAPWRAGQGVRVTPMTVEPTRTEDAVAPMSAGSSKWSNIEDAVAWYGDTAVPVLADTGGFCAALLFADWASGQLLSETVWQDARTLAASRSAAAAGEAAAAAAINGVLGTSAEYRLVSSSARPA